MSDKVKDRQGVAIPKLKMYLLNEKDSPRHAPVDPKMLVGSKEQRIAEGKFKAGLVVCERRLGKLNALSVETPQAETLNNAIVKAKEFAAKENYISALDTLKKAESSKLKNKGRSVAKEIVKDAKKKFSAEMEQADKLTNLLSKPEALLMSQTEAGEFRSKVKAALQPLFQNATEEDGVEAAEALEELEEKILELKSSYEDIRQNTVDLNRQATDQLGSITAKLPPETLAPLRERLQGVGTLMAENEWVRAEQAVTAVADDIQDEFDKVGKREELGKAIGGVDKLVAELDQGEWNDRRKELPSLRERLVAVAETGKKLHEAPATAQLYVPFPDPALGGIGTTLKTLLENKAAVTLDTGKGLSPAKALEAFSGMKANLEEVEKRVALLSNPKFVEVADIAQNRVTEMVGRVDKALLVLRKALTSIEVDADPVCKPFEDERDLVKNGFLKSVASAKSGDAINPKETIAALLSLSIRVDDLAGDDRALGEMITKTEADVSRVGFTAELKRAQEAVDTLTVMDPLAAEKLRDELDKLETQGSRAALPAIFDALANKAGVIAEKAAGKADTTGDWIAGARDELNKALAKARPLVEKLNKEVTEKTRKFLWVKGDNQEEKYGRLRDFLNETLREQLAAVEVDSLSMLTSATDAATKLAADAQDALDDLAGNKPKGSKGTTLDTHAEQLAKLKRALQRSVFASFGGDSANELIARIDTLADTVPGMPLQDGRKAIVDVTQAYGLLAAKVKQAQKDYNAWKKDVSAAQDEAKKIGDEGANYRKHIKEQIKACRQLAHREGGLDNAKLMLQQIRDQIDQVVEDPAVCGQAEQTAKTLADKKKEDAKVWKSRYELGIKRCKEVAGMLTKNRSEIRTLVDQANTLFKQTGDFDLAMSQLDVAMARADYVEKNPEGVEITRRKNLPSVEKKWREKLGGMKAAFDKLVQDHVQTMDPTAVPDDVKTAVKNAAAEAGGLFNPAEFEQTVKALTDERRSIKDKLAERERALRRIETLLGHFEGNPLLRQLMQNPFEKNEVHAGIASSRFALLDMQNNLLGCMPKNTYD